MLKWQTSGSFFEKDEADFRSYFAVAGIHGRPYIPWGGAQGQSQFAFGGYCTHGSVLFPTWHRPYLALYEVWISLYLVTSYRLKANTFYSNLSNRMLWFMRSYTKWTTPTGRKPRSVSVYRSGLGKGELYSLTLLSTAQLSRLRTTRGKRFKSTTRSCITVSE